MRSLTASALHELFIFNNLQGYLRDARSDGIAPKRGTVLARLNRQHDFVVGQNCRDRVHPSRKGLSQNEHVGAHIGLGIALAATCGAAAGSARSQPRTGTADARLDFVGHKEHIRRTAAGRSTFNIAV